MGRCPYKKNLFVAKLRHFMYNDHDKIRKNLRSDAF